jgi:hypothetical protein
MPHAAASGQCERQRHQGQRPEKTGFHVRFLLSFKGQYVPLRTK